jgi:hypothetical protein
MARVNGTPYCSEDEFGAQSALLVGSLTMGSQVHSQFYRRDSRQQRISVAADCRADAD